MSTNFNNKHPQGEGEGVSTYIHQAETGCGFLPLGPVSGAHGPGGTSWVDKKPSLHFKRLKTMCPSPQQDINIHLSRCNQQGIRVPLGKDGMAMGEANAKTTVGDDFGERKIGRIDIEVALN